MANEVRIRTTAPGAKQATGEIKSLHDAFTRLQKGGAQGFAIGAGAAVTTKAFDLMGSAVSAVIGTLDDAVKAAMADEESVNRLSASLKANVPAWAGNTDAIEANILAKQRLGFDDETLRDSLTVLAGATHDVTKAQEVMATAMDLARFKGIDLRTASEALIKVEGGQYRSLKQLGIKLKDGATATEALAAVQAVATGQAEAYANTTSGKVVAAQIKLGEAEERLGTIILPLVADAAENVSGAIEDMTQAVDDAKPVFDALGYVVGWAGGLQGKYNDAVKDAAVAFKANQEGASHLRVTMDALAGAEGDATTATSKMMTKFDLAKAAADGFAESLDSLSGALFGLPITVGDLAQAQKDLAELIKKGPDGKTKQDWDIYNGLLAAAEQKVFDLTGKLGELGGMSPTAFYEFLQKANEGLAGAAKQIGILNQGYALMRGYSAPTGGPGYVAPIDRSTRKVGARASGGPASGQTLVGEKGPEIVDLPGGSMVHSNADSQKMGGVTINLIVQGDLRAKSKEDVVSALQRAASFIR